MTILRGFIDDLRKTAFLRDDINSVINTSSYIISHHVDDFFTPCITWEMKRALHEEENKLVEQLKVK